MEKQSKSRNSTPNVVGSSIEQFEPTEAQPIRQHARMAGDPAHVIKNPGDGYKVKTPNAVHAKNTTKNKAQAQARLLNGIEHGWKPTGQKGMGK